jgi:hypothetical protein
MRLEYNHLSDAYSFALLMWELRTRCTFEFEEAVKRGTRPSLEGIDASYANPEVSIAR